MSDKTPRSFVEVKTLIEDFLAKDREAYLEAHPYSVLLVDDPGDDEANASFQTISRAPGGRDRTDSEKLLGRMGQATFAVILATEQKKFASMVTVGRGAGSGVRLNVPSVSKFHAYLTHVARDGCWYVADANSSNGTFVNGKDLPPSHGKMRLEDGALLRFGPDVTAQYYTSAGLWTLFDQRLTETPEGGARGQQKTAGDED